ncbi:hypothetical protein [Natrinema ejinorense]|uniref:Uncharacterized protein n=1 Tax=Natrinema ejinorense TaxID=373386 RepID=A0A2A5QQZ5_9EURY|nr:hypothetical protein [Natrinema ejinorense]PCR89250.1 hypothetical protein CP557_01065 [Natrinema ejinorense]
MRRTRPERRAPRRTSGESDRLDSPIGHDYTGMYRVHDRTTVPRLGDPVEHAGVEKGSRCPSVNARSRIGGHRRSV